MDGGRHIGYRRGKKRASWWARYNTPNGGYLKKVLGVADDTDDADGEKILSYGQAQTEARKWFTEQERQSGETTDRTYTVKSAIRDYLAWYKEHRAKTGARPLEHLGEARLLAKHALDPELGTGNLDTLYALYQERIQHYLEAPPAAEWGGVFVATSK